MASPRKRTAPLRSDPAEWPTGQLSAEPWLKWPEEKPSEYYAFCAFRDLAGAKSIDRAYRYMRTGDPDSDVHVKANWSWRAYFKRWRWQERVDEYERYQERRHLAAMDDATLAAYREMGDRHAREAMALQAKALERLRGLDPSSMNADQVLRFIVQAAALERLARGASLQDLQTAQRDSPQTSVITYVDDWRGDQRRLERLRQEGSRYGNGQGVLPSDVQQRKAEQDAPEEVPSEAPAVTITRASGKPQSSDAQSWWEARLERPIGDDPWKPESEPGP